MDLRHYGLQKTWVDQCLKCQVSKDSLTGNMGNGLKHPFNLSDSTFTIFLDHC